MFIKRFFRVFGSERKSFCSIKR